MRILRGVVLLGVAGGVATLGTVAAGGGVGEVRAALTGALSRACDASAVSDARTLGLALQSVALVEGDLSGVTADALVDWGWTGSATTTARVWVDGERFVVHARDVRPGAATFEVDSGDLVVREVPSGDSWADAPDGELPVDVVVVEGSLPG